MLTTVYPSASVVVNSEPDLANEPAIFSVAPADSVAGFAKEPPCVDAVVAGDSSSATFVVEKVVVWMVVVEKVVVEVVVGFRLPFLITTTFFVTVRVYSEMLRTEQKIHRKKKGKS